MSLFNILKNGIFHQGVDPKKLNTSDNSHWRCNYWGSSRTAKNRPMSTPCGVRGKTSDGQTKPHVWSKL